MFISAVVRKMRFVSAGRGSTAVISRKRSGRRLTGFIFASLLLCSGSRSINATTALEDDISNAAATERDVVEQTGDVSAGAVPLANKYRLTNGGQCALIIASVSKSSSIDISFIPGPRAIATLQTDIPHVAGATTLSIAPGPAALAAGKSVASNNLGSADRIILFGLSQTPIDQGIIATINLSTSGMVPGTYAVYLTNFIAVGFDGIQVPLCATSGGITK